MSTFTRSTIRRLAIAAIAAIAAVTLATTATATATAAGPADASYVGYKIDGGGDFALITNSAGDIKAYDAIWDRKVCGIRGFNVYFDWKDGTHPAIPVDDQGSFYEAFSLIYRQSGRKFRVRVTNYGYFGTVREVAGQSSDQAYMRMSVRIKQVKRGAKWCGYKKQSFLGFRV